MVYKSKHGKRLFYLCIISILETVGTSEVTQGATRTVVHNAAQILIIADGMAGNLMMDHATVFTLQMQEGYSEVATLLRERKLSVSRFKVIVLLLGRADLWEADHRFKLGVNRCLAEIRSSNTLCSVVLTATIPSPSDMLTVVRTATYRNGYLSQLAHDSEWLEFAKPGKQLLVGKGPAVEFFDEFNNLNDNGLDVVRRGIEAKLRCAKVFEKVSARTGRRDS